MTTMQVQVLSTRETIFNKGKEDEQKMFQIFAADDTGAVGSVYSRTYLAPGDVMTLGLTVNRDGKFAARIIG